MATFPRSACDHLVPPRISTWIQFALSTPVVLWAGWPFFQRGWASVVHRSLNMFSLIALGTGAAYLYSLFATFLPGLFPAGFRGRWTARSPVYFEAAAVITVLVLLGQVLELRAREADRRRDPRVAQAGAENRAAHKRRMATTRRSRSIVCRSATGCGCGPATACRSMVSCWKAKARSMSPW